MTNLRQGRRRDRVLLGLRATSLTAAAALTGALLLPARGWAAPHSHAHRALPTALHTSAITETASHPGKKGKHGIKSKVDAVPEGTSEHGAGAKGKGKQGKSRRRQSEPVEDVVPMYRAGRESRSRGRESALTAMSSRKGNRRSAFANGPAPLVSRDSQGHGHILPAPRGSRFHEPAREQQAAMPFRTPRSPVPGRSLSSVMGGQEPRTGVPASVASVSHPATKLEIFAQGVSRPEDDERLPRPQDKRPQISTDESNGGSNVAPVVRVTAAPPPATAAAPSPQKPDVVQGFGGEVAVPLPDPGTRPGGTHRRNHPSNWVPEPTAVTSEPLEERETITEAAVSPVALPDLYDRNGRLVMRAPLKGSRDVLIHQNVMADNDGLERIQTDADLERLRAAHLLVTLPASESLHVNDDLPANRRVARPWTAMFAADIGRAFYLRFREPIYLTSAARTVQYQARLQTVNGNAAGLWGDTASPHLTGQAVDLAKRGMSSAELAWMRGYLQPLMQAGKIDVEEEFHQACFHVSVYRSYAAGRRLLTHEVAQVHTAAPAEDGSSPGTPDEK
ncbi:MAG TPA: DUF5715 family protein [Acidobacteriaceae bacterium]|nr:DUF5715 family protein [Acidobacteriaceae bacterium]